LTEAIKMAQTQTWDFESNKAYTKFKYSINDIIQTLKQPKTPKCFDAEMEIPYIDGYTENRVKRFYGKLRLKTTTNSEGKHVFVGHYEY